jgi:hypothetical protein
VITIGNLVQIETSIYQRTNNEQILFISEMLTGIAPTQKEKTKKKGKPKQKAQLIMKLKM